jgi:molybdopterin-synthase adenylyltransferase
VCDAGLGGVSTRVGRVSWFPGVDSAACFACLLSSRRRAELFSMWESDIHACWQRGPDDQHAWISTPTMASIVAGLQVETALSAIGKKMEAFTLRIDLDQTPLSQRILHYRSPECPLHDQLSGTPFPICTLAQCSACGHQFFPNQRIGWIRRWGVCPSCGCRKLFVCERLRGGFVECAS